MYVYLKGERSVLLKLNEEDRSGVVAGHGRGLVVAGGRGRGRGRECGMGGCGVGGRRCIPTYNLPELSEPIGSLTLFLSTHTSGVST